MQHCLSDVGGGACVVACYDVRLDRLCCVNFISWLGQRLGLKIGIVASSRQTDGAENRKTLPGKSVVVNGSASTGMADEYGQRSQAVGTFCNSTVKAGLELPRGAGGLTPQLSFQPPYSLLFFNCHDFSRALLTLPVIFRNSNTG